MNLLHYRRGRRGQAPLCHRRFSSGWIPPLTRSRPSTPATPPLSWLPPTEGDKIRATGTPFGLLPFSNYVPQTLSLSPGMRLLAYTDGMTEVFHEEDEFGEARLQQTFLDCTEPTPEQVLE